MMLFAASVVWSVAAAQTNGGIRLVSFMHYRGTVCSL
jgi:hypothetical protein